MRAISSNIAGRALRGTDTSSIRVVPIVSMAGCIERRMVHSSSASASSPRAARLPRLETRRSPRRRRMPPAVGLRSAARPGGGGQIEGGGRPRGRGIHQLHDRGLATCGGHGVRQRPRRGRRERP
jgi:hypothetical protein